MNDKVKQDKELIRYMELIAKQNKPKQLIIRGIIIGMFSALGTILAFILLAMFAAYFLTGLKEIPFINSFIEEYKLDILIENILNERVNNNQYTPTETPNGTQQGDVETPQPQPDPMTTYTDSTTGFSFIYPSYLDNIITDPGSDGASKLQWLGDGALHSLELYHNSPPTVIGNSSERFATVNEDRVTIHVYEGGALVNGTQYNIALYEARFELESGQYTLLGYSDANLPKTAREIFTMIIESVNY